MATFVAWEYLDLGVQYMKAKKFREAILHFDEALKYKPDDARSHWNKAISLLSLGNYVQGFEEMEWRWKVFDWCWGYLDKSVYRVEQIAAWNGEDLKGKRLLMYHEQGFGDAIMMARFIPELLARGAEIVLFTVKPLLRLMADNFDVVAVDALPEDLSVFDYRCALFEPARCLNHTVLTIPNDPYLSATFDLEKDTIGFVWAGVSQQKFKVGQFLEKLECGRHQLQALQFGEVPANVKPLVARDFADTLKLIRRLEHVVTTDTAVAHLAGACGHPSAHLLLPPLPDWRWYHGYAWYPTLNIHQDWESLNRALKDY